MKTFKVFRTSQTAMHPFHIDARLRPAERLKRRNDLRQVFKSGRRAAGRLIVLYGRINELAHGRMAISIGRKYGTAVQRNRFKRLCREAYRTSKAEHPATGYDWVILPRRSLRESRENANLQRDCLRLSEIQRELAALMRQIAGRDSRQRGPIGSI